MTTATAPGKVYLFGEHAVVYGEPAVPCAIGRRARATVEVHDGPPLRIHAGDLSLDGFTVDYGVDGAGRPTVDVPSSVLDERLGYVRGAIAQAREAADAPDAALEVTVDSDLPPGSGLGSSAAVVVAVLAAATRELGADLDRPELADRAYQVEHDVQAGGASRADTFCSTMGGAVRVEGEECRPLQAVSELPIVVGYDGGGGATGDLVADVRALREEYDVAADTVAAIGDVVRAGERRLVDGEIAEVGRLMDVAHGLLAALGVSSRSLDAMAWAARGAGAHGAKLTGAGGGGCVVALDDTGAARAALEVTPACVEAFSADLATEGVKVEAT